MSTNVALLSEAAPAPQPRGVVHALSAAGVNDVATLARQQLPSAVPAPTLIAAYNASIQQQPSRPARSSSAVPSSALAAQFIAQGAVDQPSDLDIFVPRPAANTTPSAPAEDDYLRDMRIARGDIAAPAKVESKPTQASQATEAAATASTKSAAQAGSAEQTQRATFSQIAAGLPALFSGFIKRPTLFTARGVSAYQLTAERNAALKSAIAEAS